MDTFTDLHNFIQSNSKIATSNYPADKVAESNPPIQELFKEDFNHLIASSWKRAEKRSFISSVIINNISPNKYYVERVMESNYTVPFLLRYLVKSPIKLKLLEKTYINFDEKRAAAVTTLISSDPDVGHFLGDNVEQISTIIEKNGITEYTTKVVISNFTIHHTVMPLLFTLWGRFQNRIKIKENLPLFPSPSPADTHNEHKH